MLKNMTIGKRLITGFILAIFISNIAGIIGISLLNTSNREYKDVLENYGFAQGELGNLGRHFQASRVLSLYVITAPDAQAREKYVQELATEDANIDEHMLEVKARLGTEAGQQIYSELSTAIQKYRVGRDEALEISATNPDTKAMVSLYREKASSALIRETIDTMVEDKSRLGYEKSDALVAQSNIFIWLMIGIMLTAIIVAMLLAIYISRSISKPIIQIKQAASKLSKGDYDVEITHYSRDEVGNLADNMRKMTEMTKAVISDTGRGLHEISHGNFDISPRVEYIGVFKDIENAMVKIITDLSKTISQIEMSSDQVSSGANQVSNGAQALAQGATEQASSVEELSASISEVSEQIMSNATDAAAASSLAVTAGAGLTSSNEQMAQMISAMNEISDSSTQISKIIKTIEDIAFQTNILALNAAVEAARAGVAGKGFAVVADEVRSLATKSSEAAKQTNVLIETSVKSVENGVKIADETAKSLSLVVEGATAMTGLINRISQASTQQSTSISQINLGIDQISSVVQTNSATSEESAASSEELRGQAQILKELVGEFKLKSDF